MRGERRERLAIEKAFDEHVASLFPMISTGNIIIISLEGRRSAYGR